MKSGMKVKWLYDSKVVKELNDISCLSQEYTYLFFKELNPNKKEHKKIYFRTEKGIHYFEFRTKCEGVKQRWKRIQKIAEQKGFIGWIPPTEKMNRRLKLKMLNEKYDN